MIRAASQRGRLILDKYYSLTDDSIIYRIAMSTYLPFYCCAYLLMFHNTVLHPHYKIQYFRDKDWQEEWIAEAINITRSEWTTFYKVQANDAPPAAAASASAPSASDTLSSRASASGNTSSARVASSSRTSAASSSRTVAPAHARSSSRAVGPGRHSAQQASQVVCS